MRICAVRSLAEFLGFPGDPEDFGQTVDDLLSSGRTRPEWCLVAEEEGELLGRVGLFTEPTLPGDVVVGPVRLPEREVKVFGLALPWHGAWEKVGSPLLRHAAALRPRLPDDPQLRINPTVHSHPERRRRVAEDAGFTLFQEKDGVLWERGAAASAAPTRLRFRTMAEVGSELLVELVARVGSFTLDRNDRHYFAHMAPRDWARVYVSFFDPPGSTLVGFRDRTPVGFVALSPFDEPETATITFVGVVPEERGNGYVDDLLLAANAAATKAGFRKILSDVDVENEPMLRAMERCGHRADATPWHVWHYRAERPDTR